MAALMVFATSTSVDAVLFFSLRDGGIVVFSSEDLLISLFNYTENLVTWKREKEV